MQWCVFCACKKGMYPLVGCEVNYTTSFFVPAKKVCTRLECCMPLILTAPATTFVSKNVMVDHQETSAYYGKEQEPAKVIEGMKRESRLLTVVFGVVCIVVPAIVSLLVLLSVSSCSTPTAVDEHHSHYSKVDSEAVEAHVDARLSAWRTHADSLWSQKLSLFFQEQTASSSEREVTTETVTTMTDSLGRVIRTEQRTTERLLSQRQRMLEQRMAQEYESRLRVIIDSMDGSWQERIDALTNHSEQNDSSSLSQTPVVSGADNRPWYVRWRSAIEYMIVGAVVALALVVACRIWLKIVKR